MKIITDIKEWLVIRNNLSADLAIGFVPTMGCLHDGHASLIKKSVTENDITVLSIFINPTQFNDPKDFQNYPQKTDADIALATEHNVDYIIIPDVESMYQGGNQIQLTTDHPFSAVMEGRYRPGHFNGMLTIVMKLLLLIRSNLVYFGEKDYQQYFLVVELIKKYFIPSEIILCPIVREISGLPLSSRNTKLSPDERNCIETFYTFFYTQRPHTLNEIKEKIDELNLSYDYFEIHNGRLFFALRVGSIRIIDNLECAALYIHEKQAQIA